MVRAAFIEEMLTLTYCLNINFIIMKKFGFLLVALVLLAACVGRSKQASQDEVINSKVQTFCSDAENSQFAGEQDGYIYELWNQYGKGTACMTIDSGALFSGKWEDIENYLARRGLGYDQTLTHQEIGRFKTVYNCDYRPTIESGNSYLSVYGWTVDPLTEYYVVEDWRRWIPSMAEGSELKGTLEIDGSIYDIYESLRVNQPSIVGDTTFKQYFSIRRDVRNSGSIDISAHFDKWESLGMELGKMYEVSFVVEGYKSNGSFEFTELEVLVEPNQQ
jgi:endo-1,4-beta-xylanase